MSDNNKVKNLKKCDTCPKKDRQKNLKKINGNWFCKKCNIKKRKEHREYLLREICGVRKRSDLEKEWAAKRKLKEEISKRHLREMKEIKSSKFNIKNTKRERIFGRRPHKVSYLSFYITRNEKEVLYSILIKKGYSYQEANNHIKQISKKMSEFSKELNKKERKDKKDISMVFKEEFAKLIDKV